MKNWAVPAAVAAVVLVIVVMGARRSAGDVESHKARELVAQGAMLLDVRTPGEFRRGHLPGARNIPLSELWKVLDTVGPKDKPIVVYCEAGTRSRQAASMLRSAGYKAVHDLGAMRSW